MYLKNLNTYYTISINEKGKWTSLVNKSNSYDFYHTWQYHSMEASGEAFLFVYEFPNNFIALPLIKRKIENSIYFDCTSVYGYPGPVSSLPYNSIAREEIVSFKAALTDYFQSSDIVSVFSRLHPLMNQELILSEFEGILDNGQTVCIDLALDIELIRANYGHGTSSSIQKLKKKGYTVREAKSVSEIESFVDIYHSNMERVNALPYYFFKEEYFLELLNTTDFSCKLFLVYLDDIITSGSIITLTSNIMQYHLSGTHNDFYKDAPVKLLIDEVALFGQQNGMRYFHLGGGIGGANDSLFKFKAGFSDLYLNFSTWRFIANKPVYDELVLEISKQHTLTDTFPLYRSI